VEVEATRFGGDDGRKVELRVDDIHGAGGDPGARAREPYGA
jgi:hypothetical protein